MESKNIKKDNNNEGLHIGSIIDGKYKILARVGKGGMSVVWLALYEKVNKQWAIKEVRKSGDKNSEIIKQNLITEAGILKKLHHDNLPSIVDIIDREDTYLIIMDYIEGRTLKDILDEQGPQSQEDVVNWAIQLCSVFEYLHSREPAIIYRDMKPSNVMLRPDGRVILIDFGTAREYKHGQIEDTTHLGTKGYAAPEQYGGSEATQTDARTDIYNLGVTMYHLVTGKDPVKPPFELKPIRQWDPSLSTGLEKIILKCIEVNPDNRYQTAQELRYDLEHYRELETSYILEKKKNFKWFTIALVFAIISLIGSGITAIKSRSLASGTYEEQIKIAETTTDSNKARLAYEEAIKLDPTKLGAYMELLDNIYLSDGVLTQDEANNIMKILGYSNRGDITNEEALSKNKEDYDEFAYKMGLMYFYYYNEEGNKSLSKHWFDIARNSNTLPSIKKDRAERFYQIADANNTSKQLNKAGDTNIDYEQYWKNFVSLSSGNIAKEDNVRTALVVYKEFAGQINQHALNFKNAGIKKNQLEEELNSMERKVNEIVENNQEFNKEVDSPIVKAIDNNIKSARTTIDIVFQEKGGKVAND